MSEKTNSAIMIDTYRKLRDSGRPEDVPLWESYAITYFGTLCDRLELATRRAEEAEKALAWEKHCREMNASAAKTGHEENERLRGLIRWCFKWIDGERMWHFIRDCPEKAAIKAIVRGDSE